MVSKNRDTNNASQFGCIVIALLFLSFWVPGGEWSSCRAQSSGYQEAPQLKEPVAAGKLPPVEQRLPENPLIVQPVKEIGHYGGTLQVLSNEPDKLGDGRNAIGRPTLIKADYDGSTLIPNFAQSWDWNADGTILTFHLRKGIKWSDGVPFSMDDIRFWWEDVLNNRDLYPNLSEYAVVNGKAAQIEFLDDTTFRMIFAGPYPQILNLLAISGETSWSESFCYPKHYFKQFHARYADPAELARLMEAGGFKTWMDLFRYRANKYENAWKPDQLEIPTLHSHIIVEVGPDYIIQERNPYYWKVDPAGQQLPYIDRIYTKIVPTEMYHAQIAAGEADFAARRANLENLQLYQSASAAGNYRVLLWRSPGSGEFILQLNFTHPDAVLRQIIQDRRFRQALSVAINREEFNNIVNNGLAMPQQASLALWSKFMEPDFATAYAEYDPAQANLLLDEIGLAWDAAHQFRLRPDGAPLALRMEISEIRDVTATQLLTQYFQAIGVDLQITTVEREIKENHLTANAFDCHLSMYGMLDRTFIDRPTIFIPTEASGSNVWAPLWTQWYASNGQQGEEPPAEVKRNFEQWRIMRSSVDETVITQAAKAILRSQAENLWSIGITTWGPLPVIARNTLENVMEEGIYTYDLLMYAQYANPDQWYLIPQP